MGSVHVRIIVSAKIREGYDYLFFVRCMVRDGGHSIAPETTSANAASASL